MVQALAHAQFLDAFDLRMGGFWLIVVRDDQGRLLRRLDDFGNREGLARSRGAEQRAVPASCIDAQHEVVDGARLVTGRFKRGVHLEFGHALIITVAV